MIETGGLEPAPVGDQSGLAPDPGRAWFGPTPGLEKIPMRLRLPAKADIGLPRPMPNFKSSSSKLLSPDGGQDDMALECSGVIAPSSLW